MNGRGYRSEHRRRKLPEHNELGATVVAVARTATRLERRPNGGSRTACNRTIAADRTGAQTGPALTGAYNQQREPTSTRARVVLRRRIPVSAGRQPPFGLELDRDVQTAAWPPERQHRQHRRWRALRLRAQGRLWRDGERWCAHAVRRVGQPGIRVNCVAAWYIHTPLAETVLKRDSATASCITLWAGGEPRPCRAAFCACHRRPCHRPNPGRRWRPAVNYAGEREIDPAVITIPRIKRRRRITNHR
jgi:hypothetical protein